MLHFSAIGAITEPRVQDDGNCVAASGGDRGKMLLNEKYEALLREIVLVVDELEDPSKCMPRTRIERRALAIRLKQIVVEVDRGLV